MYGIVSKTKVGNLEVSTCMIDDFVETMVFDDLSGETDIRNREFTRRHRSRKEATEWHAHVVGVLQREATEREGMVRCETSI